jgi:hypothetical protein
LGETKEEVSVEVNLEEADVAMATKEDVVEVKLRGGVKKDIFINCLVRKVNNFVQNNVAKVALLTNSAQKKFTL